MKIQRKYIYEIWASQDLTKAVAMTLLIREKVSNIIVRDWSYAKLCALTSLSYRTVKKYLAILLEHGYAQIEGANLIFPNLKSKHDDRNVMVKVIITDTVREVSIKLRLMFIDITNRKKRFAHTTIGMRPNDPREVKNHRRLLRKLGWQGKVFCDNGISMSTMARVLRVSRRTMVNQLNYAASKGWLKRILRELKVYAQHLSDDMFRGLFPSFHAYRDGYAIRYLPSYYLLSPTLLTTDKGASSCTGHRYTSDHITYYRTLAPSNPQPHAE